MPKKPKKFKRKSSKPPGRSPEATFQVKKAEKSKKQIFPKNPRIIAEDAPFGASLWGVWLYVFSAITLIGVLLLAVNVQKKSLQLAKIREQRSALEKELQHWQQINTQYPGSKDINTKLATIEYRLGDFGKAKMYVDRALQLDPNDEQALEMEKILTKRDK